MENSIENIREVLSELGIEFNGDLDKYDKLASELNQNKVLTNKFSNISKILTILKDINIDNSDMEIEYGLTSAMITIKKEFAMVFNRYKKEKILEALNIADGFSIEYSLDYENYVELRISVFDIFSID